MVAPRAGRSRSRNREKLWIDVVSAPGSAVHGVESACRDTCERGGSDEVAQPERPCRLHVVRGNQVGGICGGRPIVPVAHAAGTRQALRGFVSRTPRGRITHTGTTSSLHSVASVGVGGRVPDLVFVVPECVTRCLGVRDERSTCAGAGVIRDVVRAALPGRDGGPRRARRIAARATARAGCVRDGQGVREGPFKRAPLSCDAAESEPHRTGLAEPPVLRSVQNRRTSCPDRESHSPVPEEGPGPHASTGLNRKTQRARFRQTHPKERGASSARLPDLPGSSSRD